jgi:serine protease AprX|tara:strand:+ start:5385 stop:6947 length:1563 start_codon:yes stop_codon:yes gene_type:complete
LKNSLVILFVLFIGEMFSQSTYLVEFQDKIRNGFDPYQYFSSEAIKAKMDMGLPMYDWYDLPVNSEYVDIISPFVDIVGYNLRWFNGVVVIGSSEQLLRVQQLPFVKSVFQFNSEIIPANSGEYTDLVKADFKVFDWQLKTMGGRMFADKGLKGKGIRIAVVDVGFGGADEMDQLKYITDSLVTSWDFALDAPLSFKRGHQHGAQVTSFIGGVIEEHSVGFATEAEFLFAKISAPLIKDEKIEQAWLKAMEWAHKNGARIVNSSIAYNNGDHNKEMLTGDSCLMSRAANLAARKGMLIVNSAGNEGDNSWKYLAFPGDADSVLTVGAVSSDLGIRASYSSYGPNKSLKLKPNVCALGDVFWLQYKSLTKLQGTSFSSPLVAGFAACILQNNPSLKPMDLIDTIQKSSSLYPYFDYSHGYGIPQATIYFGVDSVKSDSVSVVIKKSPNHLTEKYYYFEYRSHYGSQIFYHIESKDGYLKEYNVVEFSRKEDSPKIHFEEYENGDILRVFHRGNVFEEKIKK